MIGTQLVNFYRDNTPAAIQSTTNIPLKAASTLNGEPIEMGIEAQPEAEMMTTKSEGINGQEELVGRDDTQYLFQIFSILFILVVN